MHLPTHTLPVLVILFTGLQQFILRLDAYNTQRWQKTPNKTIIYFFKLKKNKTQTLKYLHFSLLYQVRFTQNISIFK